MEKLLHTREFGGTVSQVITRVGQKMLARLREGTELAPPALNKLDECSVQQMNNGACQCSHPQRVVLVPLALVMKYVILVPPHMSLGLH